jgi:peptidoglycan/LPS O-acetylase OafA/YrhL
MTQAPSSAQPSAKGEFHIPSLDGIRAVSFLLVFLAHAGLEQFLPGGFGVTVFFFLSGYLITTYLRMECDRTGEINFKHFYLRRVFRIFPPFYLILGVAIALALLGWLDEPLNASGALSQLFHYSNYWIIEHGRAGLVPGSGVYWSLAVEEHFYLLFPLLYLTLRRRLPHASNQAIALYGLCGAVFLWRCLLVYAFHASEDRTYLASDTRVDSILFGCILAIGGNPVLDRPASSDRVLKCFWLPLGLLLLLGTFVYRDAHFRETWRYSIQGLALVPIFVAAIRFPKWGVFRVLNYAPVRRIGALSYSLYLLHYVVIFFIEAHCGWPKPVRGIIAFGVAYLLAALIYRFVEKPFGQMRKRLTHIASPK